MIVSLIVAASTNNAIGKNNQLLWQLPNDMKFFKNTTWAMPVVMGRKTLEALCGKPLQGRLNIVITRQTDFSAAGVTTVHALEEAVNLCEQQDYKEVFVIGGGEIYRQAVPGAHRIYLTRVHAQLEGDTYFPPLPEEEWELVSDRIFPADDKHAYAYSFQLWERKHK